jgi:hypothetical protein
MVALTAYSAPAFFAYRLKGRKALARHFSEAFVARHDNLAWGAPAGED